MVVMLPEWAVEEVAEHYWGGGDHGHDDGGGKEVGDSSAAGR